MLMLYSSIFFLLHFYHFNVTELFIECTFTLLSHNFVCARRLRLVIALGGTFKMQTCIFVQKNSLGDSLSLSVSLHTTLVFSVVYHVPVYCMSSMYLPLALFSSFPLARASIVSISPVELASQLRNLASYLTTLLFPFQVNVYISTLYS